MSQLGCRRRAGSPRAGVCRRAQWVQMMPGVCLYGAPWSRGQVWTRFSSTLSFGKEGRAELQTSSSPHPNRRLFWFKPSSQPGQDNLGCDGPDPAAQQRPHIPRGPMETTFTHLLCGVRLASPSPHLAVEHLLCSLLSPPLPPGSYHAGWAAVKAQVSKCRAWRGWISPGGKEPQVSECVRRSPLPLGARS